MPSTRDHELAVRDRTLEITAVYVWVFEEPSGLDGILTAPTNAGVVPLVFTDEHTAVRMQHRAQMAARASRRPARLLRFGLDDEILRVHP